jgi:undecaprenyl-diphosphatase
MGVCVPCNNLDLDTVARFFLGFSHLEIILPMLVLGFIFLNKPLFYHTCCLMFFSMLINVALKSTFQVPLHPSIHHAGFAFPSGHMQLATVVYGWLAWHYTNTYLRMCVAIILAGVGFGLVHFDYHTVTDVLGGAFFASLLIAFYALLKNKYSSKLPWFLGVIATLAMPYIAWQAFIPRHAWFAYCAVLVLTLSQKIIYDDNIRT